MRYVIVASVLILYVLPFLFPHLIPAIALLLFRVVLGIFCYFYIKFAGIQM